MSRVIEVDGLTKHFGEIKAVNGISFDVRDGETFGFLGPNGAGKTTTIRMLTGLSKSTEGRATILGYDAETESSDIKKQVGVVPEASNLYEELSAYDNLMFMSQLNGVPRRFRKEKVEELLKTFGLIERKNNLLSTFSRGMKRSLTIAAALTNDPKILFLDEPSIGLDVVAVRSLHNLIGGLKKKGVTIFLTTHYLEEADQLCDRIALIMGGKIIKIDTPNALKQLVEDEQIIEMSFNGSAGRIREELSKTHPELRVERTGQNSVRVYGSPPREVLESTLKITGITGLEIMEVNSVKPKLEDAFIKFTGLSSGIMATEKGGRK